MSLPHLMNLPDLHGGLSLFHCPSNISVLHMYIHRNVDSESRPGFYEICSRLSLPEFKILKWSPEDRKAYSEQARSIGAPLEEGENMFIELQKTYLQ